MHQEFDERVLRKRLVHESLLHYEGIQCIDTQWLDI